MVVVDDDWVLVYDVVWFCLSVVMLVGLFDELVSDLVGGIFVVLVVDILKCVDVG